MRTLYKLTNEDMTTRNNTLWKIGEWRQCPGAGPLCSDGWLHAYEDPVVGAFINAAHADIIQPRMFRAEGDGEFLDDHGLKCGVSRLRIVEEIPMPVISSAARARVAIWCARYVSLLVSHPGREFWDQWASGWLLKNPAARSERESQRIAAAVFPLTLHNETAFGLEDKITRIDTAMYRASQAAISVARNDDGWLVSFSSALALDNAVYAGFNLDLRNTIDRAIRDERYIDAPNIGALIDNENGGSQCV